MNKTLSIFSTLLLVLLISCEAPIDPYENIPDEILIKTESKYLVTNSGEVLVSFIEYNVNQQIIISREFDESGEESSSSEFVYRDNFVSEIRTGDNNVDIKQVDYELNSSGQVKQVTEYDQNGNISRVIRYIYDEQGRLVSKEICNEGVNCDDAKMIEYIYSDDGRLKSIYEIDDRQGSAVIQDSLVYDNSAGIDHIRFDQSGQISIITKTYYNAFGLPSLEIIRSPEGNIIKRYKFIYEYYN